MTDYRTRAALERALDIAVNQDGALSDEDILRVDEVIATLPKMPAVPDGWALHTHPGGGKEVRHVKGGRWSEVVGMPSWEIKSPEDYTPVTLIPREPTDLWVARVQEMVDVQCGEWLTYAEIRAAITVMHDLGMGDDQ